MHHCAYFANDLDAELMRLSAIGYKNEMQANTASGVRFAFVKQAQASNSTQGHYFEIYEENPFLRSFYTMIEEASQNWDGNRPLRRLG